MEGGSDAKRKLQNRRGSQRLAMNPRTIRFYEAVGLLPPPQRTAHGYASTGHRLFAPDDLERLQFIRQARLLDLSLDQIRDLLEATDKGCCGSARPHLKTLIRGKLPELRRRMAELRRLERHLEDLQKRLPDAVPKAGRPCDGTVERCVPLSGPPLLQISLRRPRRSKG